MPAAGATLADLASALHSLGLRWYVFGAQAAIHYGSPRATADVDVTVELDATSVAALLAKLSEHHIVGRLPLDDDFVARARVLPMLHTPTGFAVDVVLAGPGPEQTFLERARPVEIDGVVVPVASPTDIVVMKVLSRRPKDLDDVVGMLRARPEGLDVREARALLSELQQLLDQSDLVPELDAAIARASRR